MLSLARALAVAAILWAVASASLAASPAAVFDDRDWRGPAAAEWSEGIEREMTPALLLTTEFEEPVFLFDPTDDETITSMTGFCGKLYLGSCTRPAGTATGSVFTYDPESHQWEKVYQVNEEGLVRLEVYGDRLYIPGYDATESWDFGSIYVHGGTTWVKHRTVPRAVHEYGLAVYHDRLYLSADIIDPPPAGMTLEEAEEKDPYSLDIYGRIVSSGDGGLTWREDHRGPRPGQDVGFMTVWHDRLIVNAQGDLISFDGKRWRALGLNPNALIVLEYTDAGNLLALGTSLGLGFYDGERFWRATDRAIQGQVRSVTRFGARWVLVMNHIVGGSLRHGPGGTGYLHLKQDGSRPYLSQLLILTDAQFRDVAAQRSALRMWSEIPWLHMSDMAVSAHAFRGRLYLGTHPEGRVLVLPVVKEGTLESAPRPVPSAGIYRLSWEAATPAGTSCRLQIRAAATREMLEKQPFVGPDGNEASFFDTPGTAVRIAEPRFVQYRVLLKTEDPALTPYVKRVVLQSDP